MKLTSRANDANWRFYNEPEGTKEYKGMIDGFLRTWREYVPSCYDGSKAVPLVLSFHGAAHHSAHQYTAWQLIAERENFIVLYPESLIQEIKFNVWHAFTKEDGMPDDVEYVDKLIDLMIEKYNIDETRIYVQGQSVGDNMASTYIYDHGDRIAAAAPLSGPACISNFVDEEGNVIVKPKYQVPVIRTHGSEDTQQPLGGLGKICVMSPKGEEKPTDVSEEARKVKWLIGIEPNNKFWIEKNACNPLPKLTLDGRYEIAIYEGNPCDMVFYSVQTGEHGPYLDMADNIWSYFFSAYQRVNGEIIKNEPSRVLVRDYYAIALAEGAKYAYVNNEKVAIHDSDEHETKVINGEYYVPVSSLARLFENTEVSLYDEGKCAVISKGMDQIQVASGNRAVVFNETLRDMPTTLYLNGEAYVPVCWISELLNGTKATVGYNACYINKDGGEMSFDFAFIIKKILGMEYDRSNLERVELEESLKKKGDKQYAAHNVAGDIYGGKSEEIFQKLKEKYEADYAEYVKAQ
jgi:poly(3-hydroxybutyrate) depolymerase